MGFDLLVAGGHRHAIRFSHLGGRRPPSRRYEGPFKCIGKGSSYNHLPLWTEIPSLLDTCALSQLLALQELKRAFVMLLTSPATPRHPIHCSLHLTRTEAIDAALERLVHPVQPHEISITEAPAPTVTV